MARQKIVIATERWNTKNGEVIKAVVRGANGEFLGATNQTTNIPVKAKRKSVSKSGFFLVGK